MECSIPPAGSIQFGKAAPNHGKRLSHSPNNDREAVIPGIVGIISQRPSDECQRFVKSMSASMEHEHFMLQECTLRPKWESMPAGWRMRTLLLRGRFSSMSERTLRFSSRENASSTLKRVLNCFLASFVSCKQGAYWF
jgi:hypothetical protein